MTSILTDIAAPLLKWFETHKRPLPWREDQNPYHVWVSEIMLQQTRIEAVMAYYARFTEALPDIASLSQIDDDALLKLWEGLGYYSRARNLKKAARMMTEQYGGSFPGTYAEIIKLPGVGEYTAGAIASICFNERVPAVDGNVLRVTARLTGNDANVLLPETKRAVTKQLAAVMPPQAGAFNEALMELGETVCLPNGAPLCEQCPLRQLCTACAEGSTETLPIRIKVMKRKSVNKTVFLIIAADGDIAVEKRAEPGLLSGMYQLPNIDGYYSEQELTERLSEWGTAPQTVAFFKKAKHVFTHVDWHMRGCRVSAAHKSSRFLWVSPQDLTEKVPLPTAFRKLLDGYSSCSVQQQLNDNDDLSKGK